MSMEMMNTREIAEYLGIHEKQVYALIKAGRIPCTRVTGKWLFPKNLIDEWIEKDSRKGITGLRERSRDVRGALLASGSNDPVLDILLNYMKQLHPDFHIFSSSTGSTEGLELLSQDLTDIAWCHLFDPKTGEYNIPYLSNYFSDRKIAVVHLFYRELGFLSAADCPVNVSSFSDLAHPEIRFINRQKGSGTRLLIDHNLEKENIDATSIAGYDTEVYTHVEVGLSILSGVANTGIATIAISKLFGLNFAPIVRESFDMVLPQSTFFEKRVQAFIETLNNEDFKERVRVLGNYDFSDAGKIIYSSPS